MALALGAVTVVLTATPRWIGGAEPGVTVVAAAAGEASAVAGGSLPPELGLATFFLIGLLGGAHCVGMCGPLVTTYARRIDANARPDTTSGAGRTGRTDGGVTPADAETGTRSASGSVASGRQYRQHALFNAGRTLGYAAVGALMGGIGAVAFDAAAVASVARPVQATVGLLIGTVVVAIGVSYVIRGHGTRHLGSLPVVGDAFRRVTAALTGRVDAWVQGPRIVGLGLVHALLPCPLLYPAYLAAVAAGSPTTGALSLGALGLGTFPAVFATGTVLGSLSVRSRVRLQRALGVVFVVLGYILLAHGLMFLGIHVPHPMFPHYRPA
jgi:hypothetical protein